jgi:hypothetical protein
MKRIGTSINEAIKRGLVPEPFKRKHLRVLGLAAGTSAAFIWKHRRGNDEGWTELYIQLGDGWYVRNLRHPAYKAVL